MNCPFCTDVEDRIYSEYSLVFAIKDNYPVSEGHTLVIPRAHKQSFIELSEVEAMQTLKLSRSIMIRMAKSDKTITGFNLGWNVGPGGGQTVNHAHFHIIPRRDGDVENPRGGIRNIIPGKGDY